ncbi:unnamed protein product [Vitrella brassicaformis CCMP3155]|uniref:Ribosomal protein L7/L12 C-terminal domain-containing protein n=1 Tax=Vitrella brassicaformis (strain CCMP3155) TaxID=1169540 RepID=A0A0G4GH79_VITBC|nr:unnamed protein product [Vitrella brassicaformis CCMP3155]|eukprot:CEM28831.1 unnamed protein product [Vitrella brassicaformis CCMP3155]
MTRETYQHCLGFLPLPTLWSAGMQFVIVSAVVGCLMAPSHAFTLPYSPSHATRPSLRRTLDARRPPTSLHMSTKTEAIVEELKGLTLLEASELVKQIEEAFGVDASAAAAMPMGAMMMPGAAGGAAEAEEVAEQTEFDVILEAVENRIGVIKVLRQLNPELNLKQAKEFVDGLPKAFFEGVPKDKAEDAKKKLEDAGAKITVK